MEGDKKNQQKRKVYGEKSRENHVQVSESSLPVEPHDTLIPPAMNCGNTCGMLPTRGHWPGFLLGVVTQTPSAKHLTKIPDSQK